MIKDNINKIISSNLIHVVKGANLAESNGLYDIASKAVYLRNEYVEDDFIHEVGHWLDYALGESYNNGCMSDSMPMQEVLSFLNRFEAMDAEERFDILGDYQNEIIDDIVQMSGIQFLFAGHFTTNWEVLKKEVFAEVVLALYNNDNNAKIVNIFPKLTNWISTMVDLGIQYILK